MAVDPAFPDLLTAVGPDVVGADGSLDRPGVRAALFSNANPKGNLAGRVDFIICFLADGAGPGSHAGVDHTIGPRPLRGIIKLTDSLLGLTANRLAGVLGGGIAHEVGHYWLVPGAARIRTPSAEVETPTSQDIWALLNVGQRGAARFASSWRPPMQAITGTPNVDTPPRSCHNRQCLLVAGSRCKAIVAISYATCWPNARKASASNDGARTCLLRVVAAASGTMALRGSPLSRRDRRRHVGHPATQCAPREIDALAREDALEPAQRQMVDILRDDHVRQQALAAEVHCV